LILLSAALTDIFNNSLISFEEYPLIKYNIVTNRLGSSSWLMASHTDAFVRLRSTIFSTLDSKSYAGRHDGIDGMIGMPTIEIRDEKAKKALDSQGLLRNDL
jgi:hypothetical protein